MPRPLRVQARGLTYHITARGNLGAPIYLDARDRRRFLAGLADVIGSFRWFCHAYCLMSNHFHLLLSTPEPDLARGMQRLNGRYGQRFNLRHARKGHLFEGRYGARLVESESHLLEAARYVVLNPVRAGLCASPGDWPWSSYRANAGLESPPTFLAEDFILDLVAGDRTRAQARYRAFVADSGR